MRLILTTNHHVGSGFSIDPNVPGPNITHPVVGILSSTHHGSQY